MSHHTTRHASAKRMYVEPRRVPFDPDYGAFCNDPRDPRNDTVECAACEGTRYTPDGDKCPWCNGRGWQFYDEE